MQYCTIEVRLSSAVDCRRHNGPGNSTRYYYWRRFAARDAVVDDPAQTVQRAPPTGQNRLDTLGRMRHTFWEGAAVLYPAHQGGGRVARVSTTSGYLTLAVV